MSQDAKWWRSPRGERWGGEDGESSDQRPNPHAVKQLGPQSIGRQVGLRRAPVVAMVQATDLRNRHDAALAGRGDRAGDRRVFIEREMRARSFVVPAIEDHQPPQSRRAQYDDVIEALALRGPDEPFDVRATDRDGASRMSRLRHSAE